MTASEGESAAPSVSEPDGQVQRINVAVTDETVAALLNVVEREGVTLTEAVRRLTGYGDYVYRKIREDEATVMVKKRWRRPRVLDIL